MSKRIVLLPLLLLCVAAVAQKRVTVAASVDKTSILIGEPLQLTLEATFSNPHTPTFFSIDSLAHFEVLERSKIDTQAIAGRTILRQTISLTSWDSGAWQIPALALSSVKAVTKPLIINITYTATPASQDYHDVKEIMDVQKPPRTTWYWYVVGAVLLLLLLLLLFPKTKKAAVTEVPVPKEDAYKTAFAELDALKNKSGLDSKTYFTELIRIFRTYLQHKGIHSFQQTTDDLSRQMKAIGLPHEDFKKLVATLQLSDFVKFAQYRAIQDEREHAWTQIRESITAIEPIRK